MFSAGLRLELRLRLRGGLTALGALGFLAVALTAVLVLIWAKTTPLDSLLMSGLHPIGLLHGHPAFASSLGVSVNDALLDRAKAHAQTLLALAARARTTAEN